MLTIEIEYCKPCGLQTLAVDLSKQILEKMEEEISSLRLIPSDGGRFEVTVNGQLIFSKIQSKKRAEIPEIMALIEQRRSLE